MRTVTEREKRTIRIAVIAITVYLILFCGLRLWQRLEARRAEYQKLVKDAQRLKQDVQRYENKVLLLEKLKGSVPLEPSQLSRVALVAEASAAIQRVATTGGVQLGPIRESSARSSARELASMQLEGFGPVPAMMTFLHRLETLGYPLILDALQINSEPTKPGMVKATLTIVILDFDQWKKEARNA